MIYIGGNKLIFTKNIIGIFSVREDTMCLPDCPKEYVCEPPYKACVVAYEDESKTCKAYLTSLSARTLLGRLQKHSLRL